MAWEQVPEMFEWAQEAGADLSDKVFYIAKQDSSGNFVLASAASDCLLGPIREGAASGKPATVLMGGIGKFIAGGTIAPGDFITSDGSGKAVATTTGSQRVIGKALMAADANEIFSALIVHAVL